MEEQIVQCCLMAVAAKEVDDIVTTANNIKSLSQPINIVNVSDQSSLISSFCFIVSTLDLLGDVLAFGIHNKCYFKPIEWMCYCNDTILT